MPLLGRRAHVLRLLLAHRLAYLASCGACQVRGGDDGVVLLPDLGAAVVEVLDVKHTPVALGRLNGTSGNTKFVRAPAVWRAACVSR